MSVPKGLSALEYARHILDFELCWPAKSNLEMIADCISAISKGKGFPLDSAYKYLARAIALAKEQNVTVNRLFFLDGDYMNMRPAKRRIDPYSHYEAADRTATEREQATKEWQEAAEEARKSLAKLCGKVKM